MSKPFLSLCSIHTLNNNKKINNNNNNTSLQVCASMTVSALPRKQAQGRERDRGLGGGYTVGGRKGGNVLQLSGFHCWLCSAGSNTDSECR